MRRRSPASDLSGLERGGNAVEPSGRAGGRNARRRPFASTAERRVGDGVEVHGREQSHVSKGGL